MGSVEDADRDLRLKLVDVHMTQLATLGNAKMQILIQLDGETGKISVFGNIGAKNPTLAMIDQAREELAANFHLIEKGKHIEIPENATSIPKARHYTMVCDTLHLGTRVSGLNSK